MRQYYVVDYKPTVFVDPQKASRMARFISGFEHRPVTVTFVVEGEKERDDKGHFLPCVKQADAVFEGQSSFGVAEASMRCWARQSNKGEWSVKSTKKGGYKSSKSTPKTGARHGRKAVKGKKQK